MVIVSRDRNPCGSSEIGGTQTSRKSAGTRCSASKCVVLSEVRFRRESSDYYHGLLDDPNDASYRTELGGQVLAAAAFGGLPVVPRQRHPVTVGSERKGTKTFFYWGLWNVPASYPTIRSFLAIGLRDPVDSRARGFFAAFRVPLRVALSRLHQKPRSCAKLI